MHRHAGGTARAPRPDAHGKSRAGARIDVKEYGNGNGNGHGGREYVANLKVG